MTQQDFRHQGRKSVTKNRAGSSLTKGDQIKLLIVVFKAFLFENLETREQLDRVR